MFQIQNLVYPEIFARFGKKNCGEEKKEKRKLVQSYNCRFAGSLKTIQLQKSPNFLKKSPHFVIKQKRANFILAWIGVT